MLDLAWAPLAGSLVGLVVGMTGVGGGALMAPILIVGFGVDLGTVVATDLLFATITKLAASAMHSRNKLVDWQIAKRLWVGSIPATLIIVTLASLGHIFNNTKWIIWLLAALIIVSGASMLLESKIQLHQRPKRIIEPPRFKRYRGSLTTISGFILGAIVSMTSIGAGALGAILLRALYPRRMEPKTLVATDTIHAVPVSLLAGISYLAMGQTDLQLLGLLLIGSVPAALIGCKAITILPPNMLKTVIGAGLVVIGLNIAVH